MALAFRDDIYSLTYTCPYKNDHASSVFGSENNGAYPVVLSTIICGRIFAGRMADDAWMVDATLDAEVLERVEDKLFFFDGRLVSGGHRALSPIFLSNRK